MPPSRYSPLRLNAPRAVILLVVATAIASIVGVVLERFGVPVVSGGVLVAAAVWQGQIWRLLTWVLFEIDPLSLIFSGLVTYWFGRDLCRIWGQMKFLAVYALLAVATGAGTTVVCRLLGDQALAYQYLGTWPMSLALTLVWASRFPTATINLYFAFPVRGQTLIWITVGGTVLYAVFKGLTPFVPHFLTAALVLGTRALGRRRGPSYAGAGSGGPRGIWSSWSARRARSRYRVIDGGDKPPRYPN